MLSALPWKLTEIILLFMRLHQRPAVWTFLLTLRATPLFLSDSCPYSCAVSLHSCLTLCNPMDYSPAGSSVQGVLQARNIGVGCYFLLERIFPIQGWNLCILHLLPWQVGSLLLAPPRKASFPTVYLYSRT